MSLRVWLPLVRDLSNQGLSDYSISMFRGTETYNANGKLGKCFYANGVNTIKILNIIPDFYNYTAYSISAWFYIEARNTSHSGSAIISAGNWNSQVINLAVSDWSSDHYTLLRISGTSWGKTYPYNFNLNTWYHVVVSCDGSKTYAYVNGVLIGDTQPSFLPSSIEGNDIAIGGATYYAGMQFFGRINDVRIYDHCLSQKEVKELSKGLVCHYTLGDRSIQQMNNCYSYPTFNTSSASGGWSHWGGSGHIGTYGQNTDKTFIYNKSNTYSHWVANGSGATYNYLVYQSPAFEGGTRSLCCIIKHENSLPITNSICYPTWNARSGGTPINAWTSIISLSNGFYLCKCENIQQDGSNDLVGVYVTAGNKIYISEGYLENDRTVCSDIFYPENIVYDSSGYNYHGQTWAYDTLGSIEVTSDTPRNLLGTFINSDNNTTSTASGTRFIYCPCAIYQPNYLTIAFWCKPIAGYNGSTGQGQFCTTSSNVSTNMLNAGTDYNTTAMHHRDSSLDICKAGGTGTTARLAVTFTANVWHHYAFVYDGRYAHTYIDGTETNIADLGSNLALNSFNALVIGYSHAGGVIRSNKSYYSDFRVYTTALSVDDIKQLYDTPVSIANNGTMFTQGEFVEG